MKLDPNKTNGTSPPLQLNNQQLLVAQPDYDEIWTVAEAARYLKMSPRQIWELTRRRSQQRSAHPIPFVKIHSKCLRFRKSDVQRWFASLGEKVRVQ